MKGASKREQSFMPNITPSLALCLLLTSCATSACSVDSADTQPEQDRRSPAPRDAGEDRDARAPTPPPDADMPRALDMSTPTEQARDMFTSACGDGVLQDSEECDDSNARPGDECSPTCTRTYACEPLPMECASTQIDVREHRIERVPSCGFALEPWPESRRQSRREVLDALGARADMLHIEDVLSDLNRQGEEGITAQSAARLENHDWSGFRWASGDMNTADWYPQGMTGSSDAHESGKIAGRDVVLVSWYDKTGAAPTKGARLSLADITDLSDVRYRHLLLVEPTGDASNPSFGPVESLHGGALHAGGIVWYGDYLYVADTHGGLRVFDLTSVIRASDFNKDVIGVDGAKVHAHGYKYAVPELFRYTLHDGSCGARFSFASLDRSASPHTLVTGEYRSDDHNGRIIVWELDEQTGLLDTRAGEVRAIDAFVSGQTRMQGAAMLDGNVYISSSSQTSTPPKFGRLYRTRPGLPESSISAWVDGAEDLYVDVHARRVWTAAEHPEKRDVVGIPILVP